MFGLSVLYPLVLILSQRYANLVSLFGIGIFFNATALAPTIYFLVAQQQLHKRWWQMVPAIFFITALGAGMMLNTMRAILQVIQNDKGVFERTPKFGIVNRKENWTRRRYQLRMDPIVFFEIVFALVNVMTCLLAVHLQNWAIAFFALLFSIGLLFTSGLTIAQTLAVARENSHISADRLAKHGT